ncbi:hypothetical protein V493_02217 [Pseudogymnoascus sp. VKM F-4281 (FW-2241)]|nr:hypothetical protein V493_02217 [Pseudogymnoascus sp. VKM F-4281 (FW-2241)]
MGVEVALGGWIVTFMIKVRGGDPFASGISATGLLTPRLGVSLAIPGYLFLSILSHLLFWLVPFFVASSISIAFLGFFLGPLFPAVVVATTRHLPRRLHIGAIGFGAAFGGGGACVLPFAVGAIAQKNGVEVLQPVILSMLALATALWIIGMPRGGGVEGEGKLLKSAKSLVGKALTIPKTYKEVVPELLNTHNSAGHRPKRKDVPLTTVYHRDHWKRHNVQKFGSSGLLWAANYGQEAAAQKFLREEANAQATTEFCRTPLLLAAKDGHEAVVKLLLEKQGVEPNSKDNNSQTPLSLAAESGYGAVVRLLPAKDSVDPDPKDSYGQTPLSWAVKRGHEAVVKLLLATEGVDPNSRDAIDQTPLLLAAEAGHEEVVKILLEKDGIDPDLKDRSGRTPLWRAAWRGHKAVVELLLMKEGVDPNSKDENGFTPLIWPAREGYKEVVQLLLAKDSVVPDSKDYNGWTPLSHAAYSGHTEVVKLLLAKDGVDPDPKDNNGWTPLLQAAGGGHEPVSVDLDFKDNNSRTSLWWAATNGYEALVEQLLAKDDINPDSKDDVGRTPLSSAAEKGHETVVRLLLAKDGVDADSKDDVGRTPLSWAATNDRDANLGAEDDSVGLQRFNRSVMKLKLLAVRPLRTSAERKHPIDSGHPPSPLSIKGGSDSARTAVDHGAHALAIGSTAHVYDE